MLTKYLLLLVSYNDMRGRRKGWGWARTLHLHPPPSLKNAKTALSKITKTPTNYFHLFNPLEEEFLGLYKTDSIKSGINYNKVGREIIADCKNYDFELNIVHLEFH